MPPVFRFIAFKIRPACRDPRRFPQPVKRALHRYRVFIAEGLTLLVWASAAIRVTAAAPTALSAIRQTDQRVLAVLRQPPATGLAVVSLELAPALIRGGLRSGDIIVMADGRRTHNVKSLKSAIQSAQTIGEKRLAAQVARGNKIVSVALPIGPLHADLVPVIAGTPVPPSPPATPLTKFHWHLRQVPTLEPPPGQIAGHNSWYLVFQSGVVVGELNFHIHRHGNRWLTDWNQSAIRRGPLPPIRQQIALQSDPTNSLQPWRFLRLASREPKRFLRVIRRSHELFLRGPKPDGTQPTVLQTTRALLVPTTAMALPAAALPRRPGVVIRVAELASANLATRLNCSLKTIGSVQLNINGLKVKQCWEVELLQFSMVRAAYFFLQDGTLVAMHLPHHIWALRAASHAAVADIIPARRLVGVSMPRSPGAH